VLCCSAPIIADLKYGLEQFPFAFFRLSGRKLHLREKKRKKKTKKKKDSKNRVDEILNNKLKE